MVEPNPNELFDQAYAHCDTLDAFARLITQAGQPLSLHDSITQLSPQPSASQDGSSILEETLRINLDQRFIEVTPGVYFLRTLLAFDMDPFADLFTEPCLPYPTALLIGQRFPQVDVERLTEEMVSFVLVQLLRNPYLAPIEKTAWLPRERLEALRSQARQALLDKKGPLTSYDLVHQIHPAKIRTRKRYQLRVLMAAILQSEDQAIPVSRDHWLHRENIQIVVDLAYNTLIQIGQASIKEMVQAALVDAEILAYSETFYNLLEDCLRKDQRFSEVDSNRRLWRVITAGQRDNEAVYQLLYGRRQPLTYPEITASLGEPVPEFNLVSDPRFKPFPDERWGLADWAWLNDLAYEYLLRTKQHLHANVVIALICKEQGIHRRNAIFMPDEDPRFASDSLNRWSCRYPLKAAEHDSFPYSRSGENEKFVHIKNYKEIAEEKLETESLSNTKQIGKIGKDFVAMELFHRGVWTRQVQGGKNIIEARSSDETRIVSIRVRSRMSSDWKIKLTEGRECQETFDETSYWILVDLNVSKTQPDYYIIPDWWLRNDIRENYQDWLMSHGRVRPVILDSVQHGIPVKRIEQWKDRWDVLKL